MLSSLLSHSHSSAVLQFPPPLPPKGLPPSPASATHIPSHPDSGSPQWKWKFWALLLFCWTPWARAIDSRLGLSPVIRREFSTSWCHCYWWNLEQSWRYAYIGPLSCINQWELGKLAWMNGIKVLSRISVNKNLSIIPSKMQIAVRPFLEIPAHTWTFTGCFALSG